MARLWPAIAAAVMLVPVGSAHAEEPRFNIDCDSLAPAGTPFVRGINCRVVEVDGYPRQYIVYLPHTPAFRPEKETPVVFHFHGTGGRAEVTFKESQWPEKAEEARFVAVFGSGLTYFECAASGCGSGEFTTKWHSFGLDCGRAVDCSYKPTGYPEDADWPADDVGFTDRMLADVASGLVVDPRRVFLSGFSNGSGMVRTLAIKRSQIFAAAGAAGPGQEEREQSARHVPLYNALGSRDGHILDEINQAPDAPEPPLEKLPLTYDEAFAFSAIRSRFEDLARSRGLSSIPDQVWEFHDELRIRYGTPLSDLDKGSEVIVSLQGDVGHEFATADENPEGFHNPDIFWKFFHGHPLPA